MMMVRGSIILLAITASLMSSIAAGTPALAPSAISELSPAGACPFQYTILPNDTYCKISTKTGVTVAALMAANPTIALDNVSAGQDMTIPCKPQQDCCPLFVYAAPEGTGLGDILVKRPDLTLDQLVAANLGNADVNATFVRCGASVNVPCKAGAPVCSATSPALAPIALPALPTLPVIGTATKPQETPVVAPAPVPSQPPPLATRRAMTPVKPEESAG